MFNRKYKIEIEKNPEMFNKIPVNFIYNRFDLQNKSEGNVTLLYVKDVDIYVPVWISGRTAELGIELTPISTQTIKEIAKFLFQQYPVVKDVRYKNGMVATGNWSKHNYFVLQFPKSIEELNNRMSADHRRKMSNRIRVIERDYGKIEFLCYTKDTVPDSVMERYFELKCISHDRDYGISPKVYFAQYFVSHIYALKIGDKIEAIRLECEQGDHVYDENHTYNMALHKHSPGLVIYYMYLSKMTESDKQMLFLSGGDYSYKQRFGSQELQVYDCILSRSLIKRVIVYAKRQLRNLKRALMKNTN